MRKNAENVLNHALKCKYMFKKKKKKKKIIYIHFIIILCKYIYSIILTHVY